MKKIVVISDIQLHNHQKWSTVENGFNSRLLDGIHTLEQAVKLCDGGTLIVSGDLFHDSKSISIDVLYQAGLWLNWAAEKCERIIIAAGNHDHMLKSGTVHSLETLRKPNVTVVDESESFWLASGDGDEYYFSARSPDPIFVAAYTEDLERLRAQLAKQPDHSICILHQDVKGGIMNGGKISEKGLSVTEFERFKYVLLGHFHEHQKLAENAWFVGSPYQIDKGEMGQPKFMALLEDGELSWVPVTGTPQYHVVSYEAFRKVADYGKDFWEVVCTPEQRDALLETPPIGANYEVVPERVDAVGSEDGLSGSVTVAEAVQEELVKMGAPHLIEIALARLPR